MTADYAARNSDVSPVSPGVRPDPSYAHLSMSSNLSPYSTDYVAALSGALGQIDINSMVSVARVPVLFVHALT